MGLIYSIISKFEDIIFFMFEIWVSEILNGSFKVKWVVNSGDRI